MKNESLRHKKIAKKRRSRKDYERRRNINRKPPSKVEETEKDVMTISRDKDGEIKTDKKSNVIMQKVGTRTISKRVKKTRKDKKNLPVVPLPMSKKNRLSKAEIKRSKKAEKNIIKTATDK